MSNTTITINDRSNEEGVMTESKSAKENSNGVNTLAENNNAEPAHDRQTYWSTWVHCDRFNGNGIETMEELISVLKETVKELKQGIKELDEMHKDGVTVVDYEPSIDSFILETENPDAAEKYGFDPVE